MTRAEADKPGLMLLFPSGAAFEARLAERFDLHRAFGPDDADAWSGAAPRVRAVLTTAVRGLTPEELARLPALQIVAQMGVGLDAVDLDALRARGVTLTDTPVLTDEVADLAIALWLAAMRGLAEGDRLVREGRWTDRRVALGRRASGRRAGVFGLGRIGRAIARRLEGFGMEIAYTGRREHADAPYRFEPDLRALAGWADALFLAAPGGPETEGVVDAAVIDALGPDGVLVNIARGSLVDEPALAAALADGRLGAAGLDVFAQEPAPSEAIRAAPRCVLSPHAGSATTDTRAAMAEAVLSNLHAWAEGREPPNRVA